MTDNFKEANHTIRRVRQWFCMPSGKWALVVVCLLFVLSVTEVSGQDEPVYDELSVFFQVQNIGSKEIPAVIRDQEVLLPIADIFDFLKIKTTLSAGMDSVSGFFLSPEAPYQIDRSHNLIIFHGKTFQLKNSDFVRTETNLYLLSKYFGEIFGLDCKFNIRTLAVDLTTKLELPVMREMKLEQMRQNISRLKGDVKVDTTLLRSRPAFHFGMADWSVISTQQLGFDTNTRFNLALGSVLLGGEANVFLNYNTNEPFTEKQQYYYWRFVNNNRAFLRQTTMGKITTDATSSIYNPVVGIRLTNAPTTFRRSFGTHPLSDYTNPGWMVELYVNNVLVDYKKADASGFFEFQVPLVYGTTNIRLKFYGPWGEERSKEQSILVPFNFLPAGEFEYAISAGMIEDDKQSIYSRGQMYYGLSKAITVGAGVEYNSSVITGPTIPFVTLATRPFSNMLLMGEFAYGVRAKGVLSLQLPKNKQIELNYIKYVPGQKAVNYNYIEERKAIFTLPIKSKSFFIYNRWTYDQIILPGTGYSTAEWLISGAALGFNTNLTNYAMFTSNNKPYIYSNLSFSFRLPAGITFMPQGQYEYSKNELISVRASLEKYVFKNGFLSFAYENNLKNRMQSAEFGFRYDFPFAQTGFTARRTNDQTTLTEMARGSIIVDKKSNYLGANNRVNVGKGGLVFAPFLDLNCNNKRDNGEPRAFGLNIRINGGTATKNDRDSTVRVMDLQPYTNYLVELDANTFDNVAWKIHNKTLSIVVDPNSFKLIEIPVQVVGEVSGMIMKDVNGNQEGLGRIIVNIFNPNSQLSGRTLSEQDGYYSYLGLGPGDYEVKIDSAQLKKLNLLSDPEKQTINIKSSIDGDVVEGIDFTLRSSTAKPKDTTRVTPPKPVEQEITREIDQTYLQVAAFIDKKNANRAVKKLAATIHYPVEIFFEDGWYKVRFGPFTDKREVDLCKNAIVASRIIPENLIKEVHQTKSEKVHLQAQRSITQQTTVAVPQKEPVVPQKETVIPQKRPVVPQKEPAMAENTGIVTFGEHAVSQSELAKGDNILKKHYFVQIAAFSVPKNATRLIKRITKLIPYSVGIVYREQYYKVRYGPFETQQELNDCIRLIVKAGIMQKELLKIFYEEIGSTPVADQPHLLDGFHVQVGAFRDKANAARYFRQMSAEYPYPILMIEEDGYYKVRFGPFKSESDTKKCRKVVAVKVTDCFMRSNTVKYF